MDGAPSAATQQTRISGVEAARRCCRVYLISLVAFWILFFPAFRGMRSLQTHQPFAFSQLFFSNGSASFSDLTNFDPSTNRNRPGIPIAGYPALGMCCFIFFNRLWPAHPVWALVAFTSVFAVAFAWLLAASLLRSPLNRRLVIAIVAASLLLSYPLIFEMERANMECVVWVVQTLALIAFVSRRYLASGLLIAAAACMKFNPAILFLLLVHKRRYKELALSLLAAGILNYAGLAIMGPSVARASADVAAGLASIKEAYMLNLRFEIGFDHSLFAALKVICLILVGPGAAVDLIHRIGLPYSLTALAGFCAVYGLRLWKLPLLNQMMILILMELLLPYTSQEYTLLSLCTAWAFFLIFLARDVAAGRASIPESASKKILIYFGLLFAPVPTALAYIKLGGVVQAGALVALTFLLLRYPMTASLFDERSAYA